MKSFLGNFHRHLAIFSGHTDGDDHRNGVKTKEMFDVDDDETDA